ncbi:MAG: peptide ABC transporter substrate-binding protein [Fluviicola sp.]|nr:peptide ABC transporter substrate-binding protein [Fluviicola sp.]
MKLSFLILVPLLLLFISCSESSDRKQFEHAGGCLKMSIDNEPKTFTAREVTDVYSATVLSQIVECLVSFNPDDLSIRAQLAKSWNVSPDGLSYTFTLRDDVLFHEHEVFSSKEERKMTAKDVVFTFEKACLPNEKGSPSVAYLSILGEQLKGAEAFYKHRATSISGIKTNGNEITLTLKSPDANFISKLASINVGIVSEKVVTANKEADLIGTGPFVYNEYTKGEPASIILLKNQDYYLTDKKGNALPYLDSVIFIADNRKLEQLELFEKGETHIINTLPTSRITQMLEGRIKDFNSKPPLMLLNNNALMATNYYFFNMTDPRFKDVRVRQAFNYAINRNKITQYVLRGQAYEDGIFGIVPPLSSSFKGYDFKAIKAVGYNYDPEKAKQLLAEAGYPGGKGFGSVNLRVNIGDIHSAVAEEISEEIFQTLGINVNIDGSTFEQKDEDARYARGDLFRTAWFADYVSPETFLSNFYGKTVPDSKDEPSGLNQARYKNPMFDELFEKARAAGSQKERYRLYNEAEKVLMQDPPIIVLWYSGDIQLVYSRVRNLHNNPMGLLDLKEVYLHDWTKEEYLKSIQ